MDEIIWYSKGYIWLLIADGATFFSLLQSEQAYRIQP